MKLNCEPGDLAVIVSARRDPTWLGRLVRVVARFGEDAWLTDPMPKNFVAVHDCALKPLRGGEGVDEMLRLAGRPAANRDETCVTRNNQQTELT